MALIHAALAVLLAAAPAYRPAPQPLPAMVWVNPAADLGLSAGMAGSLFNQHTRTKFDCASDDGMRCLPTPCPSMRMCLTVRWGQFTDDTVDARVLQVYCSGGCTKAAVIEVNPEGPLHTMYGGWTPFHHRLLMEQHFGLFTGLTVQPSCVSLMSHYSCGEEGFTSAESVYLGAW